MSDLLTDVFAGDAFSVVELTDAINLVPTQYGLLNKLGIFQEEGIPTTSVAVEFNNGVLNLIPSKPRGETPHKNISAKRSLKHFTVPHFPVGDKIFPSDVQNVREFGTNQLRTPESVMNKKLIELSNKHDITNEWLKCGAIAGKILDADGSTLLDLFSEFNVSETQIFFDLDDEDADIVGSSQEVLGSIEDNLQGDVMDYAMAACSPQFWAKFITHPKVQAAYTNYQNSVNSVVGYAGPSANPGRNDVRKGFYFGGMLWAEYRGKATYTADDGTITTQNFIETNMARFFPVGTNSSFKHYNAPADNMEAVNTVGQPKYAQVTRDPKGKFWDVDTESNPLPLCLRPKLLVKGNLASS